MFNIGNFINMPSKEQQHTAFEESPKNADGKNSIDYEDMAAGGRVVDGIGYYSGCLK